uniref:Uncharacterized protein n=1 Tax=Anguilla anguilla TaxID=7936 RepID=A0A0E9SDF6_ANGAN
MMYNRREKTGHTPYAVPGNVY